MLNQTQAREAAKVIKAGLTKAFKELRRDGYFCKQNFLCCKMCGTKAAEDAGFPDQLVIYDAQRHDSLKERGEVYLVWRGDGADIVRIIEKHGLDVEWDGDNKTCLLVRMA